MRKMKIISTFNLEICEYKYKKTKRVINRNAFEYT